MPLSEKVWGTALQKVRPTLKIMARQRLPARLWRRVDPSDVVQITLQEAYEKRRQFRGNSEEDLLPWLRPMLVNRLNDEIKRCKAKKRDARLDRPLRALLGRTSAQLRAELVASGKSPSHGLMQRESIDRMSRALESFPADQRLVVVLLHLQGLSLTEVALAMERSASAVAALHFRALENLRKKLKGRT